MDNDATAMHSVAGRAVIVTGAGRGVGRGIALHLGRCGARVVVADYDADLMRSATAGLEDRGIDTVGVLCDVRDRDSVASMVGVTMERFGRVDALVNNAQTFRPMAPLEAVSGADFDVFYESGVKGTVAAMQAAFPHMRDQGWGRVVNFASAMGVTGGSGFAAYNASKEAIRAVTRTVAREWAAHGIVVNAVAPAAADHHGEAARRSEGYRRFVDNCPMGRQGNPETDIGPIVAFLCSDACRYLTGHTFMADGGAFMWA